MVDPTRRFLDSSKDAEKRRNMRLYMREREQDREDNRTSRRTKPLPCCGRERRYCQCAQDVQHMIDDTALHKLGDDAYERNLLTKNDPKDMSFILQALHQSKMSIRAFLFHSVLFRMYSKEATYTTLCKYAGAAQPGKDEPDWPGMQAALAELYAGPDAVWGGMFYPATLRAAKSENGRWQKLRGATPKQKAARDMHVFKAAWVALCKDESAAEYMKQRRCCASKGWSAENVDAARAAFERWYHSFYTHMDSHTNGWFGDYAMKCILDVGTNCTIKATTDGRHVFPDAVLSTWPVNCPAYTTGVKKLLRPKYRTRPMKRVLKYKVLMYVHARLAKRLGAAHHSVSSTLAQICWQKRQAKGQKRR